MICIMVRKYKHQEFEEGSLTVMKVEQDLLGLGVTVTQLETEPPFSSPPSQCDLP